MIPIWYAAETDERSLATWIDAASLRLRRHAAVALGACRNDPGLRCRDAAGDQHDGRSRRFAYRLRECGIGGAQQGDPGWLGRCRKDGSLVAAGARYAVSDRLRAFRGWSMRSGSPPGRDGWEASSRSGGGLDCLVGPLAAGADLLQNLSLALVLSGQDTQPWPRIAAICGPVTTSLMVAGLAFALVGTIVTREARAEGTPRTVGPDD